MTCPGHEHVRAMLLWAEQHEPLCRRRHPDDPETFCTRKKGHRYPRVHYSVVTRDLWEEKK